jgi:hypothetical protein
LALTGCMTDDPGRPYAVSAQSGDWKIDKQRDRITGAPLSGAIVNASAGYNSYRDRPIAA